LLTRDTILYFNQQKGTNYNKIKHHKTHFTLGSNSCMLRHHRAILKVLNNHKRISSPTRTPSRELRVRLTIFYFYLTHSGWHLGTETCRRWNL